MTLLFEAGQILSSWLTLVVNQKYRWMETNGIAHMSKSGIPQGLAEFGDLGVFVFLKGGG